MNDFNDLSALFINCTLKRSPRLSHTEGLMKVSMDLMQENGVEVEMIRAVDHHIATGIQPDMREEGESEDEWPEIMKKVLRANILVIGTPIWLGERSSVCSRVIERLYSWSGKTNSQDQSIFYGRAGGCIITGNEDGVKHCSMSILYSLSHLGYVIPPQADAGWIGEIGPGPSYLDKGSGGPENEFTQRNTRIMTWNLMHTAYWMKQSGGFPVQGNTRE
ncbi:MAG: NAD(P)H-dependent oxidoreductase [Bacteroidota bacterium]|nr:NAD(P)H-dependent oxidoreductase [Bacteroidota bacterium]